MTKGEPAVVSFSFVVSALVVFFVALAMAMGRSREPFVDAQYGNWVVPTPTVHLEDPEGVLVVNLDRRVDRMESFRGAFSRSDMARQFALHRLAAVDGNKVDWRILLTPEAGRDMEEFLRIRTRKTHEQLTPGAVGCYLSHVKAWEWVMKKNKPWIVCEDDALVPPDFFAKIRKALAIVPAQDKNTVILFHVICSSTMYDKLHCDALGNNVYRAHRFWSTVAYYVTPEAARRMHAKSIPLDVQVDCAMGMWARNKIIDIFAFPCVDTVDAGTDIQYPVQSQA